MKGNRAKRESRFPALVILSTVLILSGWAGCVGLGSKTAVEGGSQPEGPVGAIEGVVTDDAIEPLGNATIRLLESGLQTNTTEDGRFSFASVAAGPATLLARKDGYADGQSTVEVVPFATLHATLVLDRLPSTRAYHETLIRKGLVCGIIVSYIVSIGGGCSGAPSRFNLSIPANWSLLVTELDWRPGGLTTDPELGMGLDGERRETNVSGGGACYGCSRVYARRESGPPIRVVLEPNRTHTEQGGLDPTPPAGTPGALLLSVGKNAWRPVADVRTVGVAWEQPFTAYHTIFYFLTPPDAKNFTMIPDR